MNHIERSANPWRPTNAVGWHVNDIVCSSETSKKEDLSETSDMKKPPIWLVVNRPIGKMAVFCDFVLIPKPSYSWTLRTAHVFLSRKSGVFFFEHLWKWMAWAAALSFHGVFRRFFGLPAKELHKHICKLGWSSKKEHIIPLSHMNEISGDFHPVPSESI